jgi:uncharacterized protein YmfQ (DUF2313 family)
MGELNIRRSGDDYAGAFADLLPNGMAWPRYEDSVLMKTIGGFGQIWGDVDRQAMDLLEREGDPRSTLDMLAEWERAFGLPDPCIGIPTTIEQRRILLVQRMTLLGGQSRQFFIDIAAMLGYAITIEELSPIMGGVSRGGDYYWEAGAPEIRYYWIVHIGGVPIWWFRGGVGEGGKDHHAEWAALLDLECILQRYKPAHTVVIFNYSGVEL